jgi:hypothetical protein
MCVQQVLRGSGLLSRRLRKILCEKANSKASFNKQRYNGHHLVSRVSFVSLAEFF